MFFKQVFYTLHKRFGHTSVINYNLNNIENRIKFSTYNNIFKLFLKQKFIRLNITQKAKSIYTANLFIDFIFCFPKKIF